LVPVSLTGQDVAHEDTGEEEFDNPEDCKEKL